MLTLLQSQDLNSEGMTMREMARARGVSVSTIHKSIHGAMNKISTDITYRKAYRENAGSFLLSGKCTDCLWYGVYRVMKSEIGRTPCPDCGKRNTLVRNA